MWEASLGGDYVLIGALQDLPVDYPALQVRLGDRSLRPDLTKMRIWDPITFFNKLVISDQAVAGYTAGAHLNTDDKNRLAYSAPRFLLQARSPRLLEELYRFRSPALDVLSAFEGAAKSALIEKGLAALFQAKNSTVAEFTGYTPQTARHAVNKLEDILALSPNNYDAAYLLARLNYDSGNQYKDDRRLAAAASAFEQSISAIDDFVAANRLSLADHFDLDVIYAKANLELGVIALNGNRLEQAAAALEKSVAGDIRFAEAHNNLGVVYARLGKNDAAAKHYRYAIELNPLLVSARMNFNNLLLQQKKVPGSHCRLSSDPEIETGPCPHQLQPGHGLLYAGSMGKGGSGVGTRPGAETGFYAGTKGPGWYPQKNRSTLAGKREA